VHKLIVAVRMYLIPSIHLRFPPTRTTYELRLLYSMAIVRMVNGLVEVEQKGEWLFARVQLSLILD
jgi:hypothetical protein